jgi:hypothetical protein
LPQFGDRDLDAALLLFEQIDLRHALLARQVQVVAVGLAEQVADFGKREAERRPVMISARRSQSLRR